MTPNSYQCSQCNGIFEKGWTDEEAKEVAKINGFSTDLEKGACIVCDDCYLDIMARIGRYEEA